MVLGKGNVRAQSLLECVFNSQLVIRVDLSPNWTQSELLSTQLWELLNCSEACGLISSHLVA